MMQPVKSTDKEEQESVLVKEHENVIVKEHENVIVKEHEDDPNKEHEDVLNKEHEDFFGEDRLLVQVSKKILMRHCRTSPALCGIVIRSFGARDFNIGDRVVWLTEQDATPLTTETMVSEAAAALVPAWMNDVEAVTFAEAAVPGALLANELGLGKVQHIVIIDVLKPEGLVAAQLAKQHNVRRVVGVLSENMHDKGELQMLCDALNLDLAVFPVLLGRETRGADFEMSMTNTVFDATRRPAVMRFIESNLRADTSYYSCDRSMTLSCLRLRRVGRCIRFGFRLCSYHEGFAWFGSRQKKHFGAVLESILDVLDPRIRFYDGRSQFELVIETEEKVDLDSKETGETNDDGDEGSGFKSPVQSVLTLAEQETKRKTKTWTSMGQRRRLRYQDQKIENMLDADLSVNWIKK